MLSIDAALELLDREIEPLPPESLSIESAVGRVLAEPACARVDLPPFDQSAMDGYALRSADTRGASPEQPVRLQLVGTVAAGSGAPSELAPGTAVRIFTGAPLPPGADAVLRQEEAEPTDDALLVRAEIPPGHDARTRGEELTAGTEIVAAGIRLTPGRIAALATAGVAEVRVRPRPRVALVTTGDELAAPGESLPFGKIYDANGHLIAAWASQIGVPLAHRHAGDELTELVAALRWAAERADLVVTTGGVSVGDRDLVHAALAELGGARLAWKVAQKPGKPLLIARLAGRPLLGLPGNPAAVLVGLYVYVARALARLEGETPPGPRFARGRLATDVGGRPGDRTRWLRVRLTWSAAGVAELHPLPRQASHMLSNLGQADALARVDAPAEAGTTVPWLPL